jgi:hypothetical protein
MKNKKNLKFDKELIAPCGMNCRICSAYLALKYDIKEKGVKMSYCMGCRARDKECAFLKKKCSKPLNILNKRIKYCFECKGFPCERLNGLDKRYRENYKMSMIENSIYIKKHGIEKFIEKEYKKWKCKKCGEVICCHNGICFNCDLDKLKKKRKEKKYRWDE